MATNKVGASGYKSIFEGVSYAKAQEIINATIMGLSAEELEEHGVDMGSPPEQPSLKWGVYSMAPYGM